MLKKFKELREIDLTGKTKKVNDYDYLPWLTCLDLLYENGAEDVHFDHTDTLWTTVNGKRQGLVKVFVSIDNLKRTITHPIALGEYSTDDPTSRQIETAISRAFVKCVAINWGLGLNLWAKSDVDAAPMPADSNIGIKITMAFDAKRQELGLLTADDLHNRLGSDKAFLAKLIQDGSREDQQAFLDKINNLPSNNNVF